jgi:hypothetical protein
MVARDTSVGLPACAHCGAVPKKYEGAVGQSGIVSLRCGSCNENPDTVEDSELHESYCVELMAWRIAGSNSRDARKLFDNGLKSGWVVGSFTKTKAPEMQIRGIRYIDCRMKRDTQCPAAIRVTHEFAVGGRPEDSNAVSVSLVGAHNHGASTTKQETAAAKEHVLANLRFGKSALRGFHEQPYLTASSDAPVGKVSLKSTQNMRARLEEGDDSCMSRDECQMVL